jgi:hypothetical protein
MESVLKGAKREALDDYRRLAKRIFDGEDVPRSEILAVTIPLGFGFPELDNAVKEIRRRVALAEAVKQGKAAKVRCDAISDEMTEARRKHAEIMSKLAVELNSLDRRIHELHFECAVPVHDARVSGNKAEWELRRSAGPDGDPLDPFNFKVE